MADDYFSSIQDISGRASYSRGALQDVKGLILHHTGGRSTPEGVVDILNKRGLGVQYVMGRDGTIYRTLPDGARGAHMKDDETGRGYSNANTIGIEMIAKDNDDLTPQQVESAKRFYGALQTKYPGIGVFGHGELNSHKQATEGMSAVNAIRGGGTTPAISVASAPQKTPDQLDYIVRTVYGEARNQNATGQQAVAAVINNRARQSGLTPSQVVMAKGQFEPWSSRRDELLKLDPNSKDYQTIKANILPLINGEVADPTNGATHFYAPKAQAALGREAPSWDNGSGLAIGDHKFFNLGYKGSPGVQVASNDPSSGIGNVPSQVGGYGALSSTPLSIQSPGALGMGPQGLQVGNLTAGMPEQPMTMPTAGSLSMSTGIGSGSLGSSPGGGILDGLMQMAGGGQGAKEEQTNHADTHKAMMARAGQNNTRQIMAQAAQRRAQKDAMVLANRPILS